MKYEKKGYSSIFSVVGICSASAISCFIILICNIIKYLAVVILSILKAIGKGIKKIISLPARALKNNIIFAADVQKNVTTQKASGKRGYVATTSGVFRYFFEKNGVAVKFSKIIIPLLSVLFLIGIVHYISNLDYAVLVECDGIKIGYVEDENVFREGLRIARERVEYSDDDNTLKVKSSCTISAVSNKADLLTSQILANEIISNSGNDVTEACGIYINDEFVGAVSDGTSISNSLADKLSEYKTMGTDAVDIQYKDDIEYIEGLYLTSSICSDDEMRTKLFSEEKSERIYIASDGDTLPLIAAKYDMTTERIEQLNPGISETGQLKSGMCVYVEETESFLPIQYTRTIDVTTYISYSTTQVSTPTLPIGQTAILVKGERGEKDSKVKITYVDGVEASRETISTVISKQPVTEQIGVGTYTAYPSDASLVLTGTGQFMWPVNGGYLSDTFMNGRVHKGIDIAANEGTEIYAADQGTVVASGWNNGGYGYMVMIDHGNGYYTLYGHCSSLAVKTGDTVLKGSLIARVGSTGDSTGNHLHFEVRYGNVCYNPLNFLNNQQ